MIENKCVWQWNDEIAIFCTEFFLEIFFPLCWQNLQYRSSGVGVSSQTHPVTRMAACLDEMKVQTFLLLFLFLYVQSCWKTNQAVWHLAQEGDTRCYLPVLSWQGSFITQKKRKKETSRSYFKLKAGRKEASQAEPSVLFFLSMLKAEKSLLQSKKNLYTTGGKWQLCGYFKNAAFLQVHRYWL